MNRFAYLLVSIIAFSTSAFANTSLPSPRLAPKDYKAIAEKLSTSQYRRLVVREVDAAVGSCGLAGCAVMGAGAMTAAAVGILEIWTIPFREGLLNGNPLDYSEAGADDKIFTILPLIAAADIAYGEDSQCNRSIRNLKILRRISQQNPEKLRVQHR